jgi:hypothetical protein
MKRVYSRSVVFVMIVSLDINASNMVAGFLGAQHRNSVLYCIK